MIVVFANRLDRRAQDLVACWKTQDAVLLGAEGLSVGGWRYYSDAPGRCVAMLAGKAVDPRSIHGVLVRWPAVLAQELTYIAAEDRRYLADEMTAFLRAWLARLPCPVLNRPTPLSLAGPGWRHEEWMHAAARLGIPVRPVKRHALYRPDQDPPAMEGPRLPAGCLLTVVGKRCLGESHASQASQALRLAEATGTPLLDLVFEGPEPDAPLLHVSTMPALSDEAADAVLEHFLNAPTTTEATEQ